MIAAFSDRSIPVNMVYLSWLRWKTTKASARPNASSFSGIEQWSKAYIQYVHIVYTVTEMSEPEKRTPISVYLTPKAAMILRDYNEGSGYGSLSRTVEEIILAFDTTYKTIKDTFKTLTNQFRDKNAMTTNDRLMFFLIFYSTLQNIDNAISRLQPAPQL